MQCSAPLRRLPVMPNVEPTRVRAGRAAAGVSLQAGPDRLRARQRAGRRQPLGGAAGGGRLPVPLPLLRRGAGRRPHGAADAAHARGRAAAGGGRGAAFPGRRGGRPPGPQSLRRASFSCRFPRSSRSVVLSNGGSLVSLSRSRGTIVPSSSASSDRSIIFMACDAATRRSSPNRGLRSTYLLRRTAPFRDRRRDEQ